MIILQPRLRGTDTIEAERSEIGPAGIIFYQNVDPRRRPEMMDAELIREDHKKIANLPDEPIYGKFSREYL